MTTAREHDNNEINEIFKCFQSGSESNCETREHCDCVVEDAMNVS